MCTLGILYPFSPFITHFLNLSPSNIFCKLFKILNLKTIPTKMHKKVETERQSESIFRYLLFMIEQSIDLSLQFTKKRFPSLRIKFYNIML